MKAYRYWAHALVISGLLSGACGGGLRYPGLTADEVFSIGRQALQDENWNEAIKAFDHVLIMADFGRSAEARYYLGQSHFGSKHFIEARSEYQRVMERWSADTIAVPAALGVCRSLAGLSPITQRDQGFTRQARLSCRQVASDHAGTLVGLRAAEIEDEMMDKLAERDYDTGLHYLKRGLVDSALLYLEDVFEQYPESQWAPWALYQMIEGFGRIEYVRDIETTRALLLEAYPESEAAKLLENGGS